MVRLAGSAAFHVGFCYTVAARLCARYYLQAGYHVVAGGKIFHGGDSVQSGHWHERFSRGGDPHPPGGNVNGLDRAHFDWGPVDASNQELYDHRDDPNEWINLAGQPEHEDVKKRLAKWLPAHEARDAPRMSKEELQKRRPRNNG